MHSENSIVSVPECAPDSISPGQLPHRNYRIDPAEVNPVGDLALDVLVKQADRPGRDRQKERALRPLEKSDRKEGSGFGRGLISGRDMVTRRRRAAICTRLAERIVFARVQRRHSHRMGSPEDDLSWRDRAGEAGFAVRLNATVSASGAANEISRSGKDAKFVIRHFGSRLIRRLFAEPDTRR